MLEIEKYYSGDIKNIDRILRNPKSDFVERKRLFEEIRNTYIERAFKLERVKGISIIGSLIKLANKSLILYNISSIEEVPLRDYATFQNWDKTIHDYRRFTGHPCVISFLRTRWLPGEVKIVMNSGEVVQIKTVDNPNTEKIANEIYSALNYIEVIARD
jgi:hypothetical protein